MVSGSPEIPVGRAKPATPPLEPWEEDQGAPRKHGDSSLGNREKVGRAIRLLSPVAMSLGTRCPAGLSRYEQDAVQRQLEEAIARARSAFAILDRGKRRTT